MINENKGYFNKGKMTGFCSHIEDGNDIYGEVKNGKFEGYAEDNF